MIRVHVWCEHRQNKTQEDVLAVYPEFMHNTIANFLRKNEDFTVTTGTLDDKDFGLSDEILENTDVCLWWGHIAHHEVPDEIAMKVKNRVLNGMGLIPLHSAHYSKPFKLLMGTTCSLRVISHEKEILYAVMPGHPIAKGIEEGKIYVEIEEGYNEQFDIPQPDELVFIGSFDNCGLFRAGCAYTRGKGKVFYFQPGHETYPIFHDEQIQTVITNAVRWAAL